VFFSDSRYQMAIVEKRESGEMAIGARDRLYYADVDGIIPHVVEDGDTLHSLAAEYLGGETGESNLWWAIADFQPDPIIDPTIALAAGTTLLIPPISYVQRMLSGMPEESIQSA